MSKDMKIGSIIKLNPEMFKSDFKLDGHFGDLGYPGVLRDWVFKVIDNIPHSHHGNTVLCEPINIQGAVGQLRLLTKDVVQTVTKVTLDYKIQDNSKEVNRIKAEIKALQDKRKTLAMKFKPLGRTMKANASEIKALEDKILELGKTTEIFITRIGKTVKVDSELLKKKDELEMFLASEVSDFRSKLKGKDDVVTKTLQGTEVKKVNGVYTKPNTFAEVYEKGLINFIKANKMPQFKDKNYLGIEIECVHLCNRDVLEDLFVKARLHKHVQVVGDGSIVADASGYKQSEIRVLVHEDELEYVMSRIGKVLSSRKVDAYANRSCGLHVHLDARNRDVEKMYANLFMVQPLLRASQPQSRIVSTYCKENRDATFKACKRGDNERYSVINTHAYDKQKSLEVRVHEGTVNAKDIINWCKFLTAVVSKDITFGKVINNVSELKSVAPSIPTEYVESRIEKFGDDLSA